MGEGADFYLVDAQTGVLSVLTFQTQHDATEFPACSAPPTMCIWALMVASILRGWPMTLPSAVGRAGAFGRGSVHSRVTGLHVLRY